MTAPNTLTRLLETLGKPLSKDQQQAVKQWLPKPKVKTK